MRVAIVTTSWPAWEGDPSGHFVETEALELERQGHVVSVVKPAPGGAFGWPGLAARLRENPLRALEVARWVARARAEVAALEVDLVVAHWAVPCGWPIAHGTRARLELVSHGADVRLLCGLPAAARERMVTRLATRATTWRFVSDALLASLLGVLSPAVRRDVEAVAVVRAPSLHVPDVGAAIARRKRDLGGARVAVSVGRLVKSKRVDRAIEHVARTAHLDGLVVVGDGPERAGLERLARERGVRARFVGTVSRHEALAWIGAAHEVVHMSEHEGLSTVLREAAALGVPVTGARHVSPSGAVNPPPGRQGRQGEISGDPHL